MYVCVCVIVDVERPFLFSPGVQRDGGHALHVRLADVLHRCRDAPLPDHHLAVVTGGHKATTLVREGDGVHRAEMVVILLNDVVSARVELDDLLVRHADQETVVVRFVVLAAIREFTRRKALDALPRLRIPQLGGTVERRRDETGTYQAYTGWCLKAYTGCLWGVLRCVRCI